MSTQQTVDAIIAEHKVVVFSKSWCPYCKNAKATVAQFAKEADIKILELDLMEEGDEIQSYLSEKSGQRTVPNIFINQTHIGGNDAVQVAKASGQLQKLLAA